MKLYDCTAAPSPHGVRIFLAEKGISVHKPISVYALSIWMIRK
jgi:glutathione S-transferase